MTRHRIARLADIVGAIDLSPRAGARMNRILVALDVDSAARPSRWPTSCAARSAGYKIGKQLFTAEGPAIVRALAERGDRVFLDLKFHDIPNTVAGAVTVGGGHRRVDGQRPLLGRPRDDEGGGRRCREGRRQDSGRRSAGHRRHRAHQHGRRQRSPRSARRAA